jgi:hypothetical protein
VPYLILLINLGGVFGEIVYASATLTTKDADWIPISLPAGDT